MTAQVIPSTFGAGDASDGAAQLMSHLRERRRALVREYEHGQQALRDLQAQAQVLRDQLLRIGGALRFLDEELGRELGEEPGATPGEAPSGFAPNGG